MTEDSATTSQEPAADGAAIMREFVKHSPFAQELGLELVLIEPDQAEIRLPFRPELATYGPVLHGGAIGATADVAAMAASFAGAEFSGVPKGATVGMSINFVTAARDTAIIAKARVVRRGKSLMTVDVDVVAENDGQLVAKALVTYKIN